jgi:hypothetical protein
MHKLNDVSLSCASEVNRQLRPCFVVTLEYDVELCPCKSVGIQLWFEYECFCLGTRYKHVETR